MEIWANLAIGFGGALTPANLGFCLIGCLLGTLIGVLPGLGPITTIAMLMPLTFGLPPLSSLVMLAGIYYGAQYGGSTTAILVNVPGEASSVVTCIDGYRMAQNGRAGAALAIAALGSFFAGCVGTLIIAAMAPALGEFSRQFSSPEYFALMVLGLIAAVVLANGSVMKAIAMVMLGLLLGLVGTDVTTGTRRFAFGIPELADGFDFLPLAMGIFGFAEILRNLEEPAGDRRIVTDKLSGLWPSPEEFKAAWPAILRGTGLGSLLGILPGSGPVVASFAAYTLEKKLARDPSRFGRGAIEGVAGPESANNAGAQTSFIPLLTLGIPSTPVMALMMGAMTIQGIAPGTSIMTKQPELFWGMVASMWIGNAMLLVINLPLVGIWVRLLRVPYSLMFPSIVIICCLGLYTTTNSPFPILLAVACTLAGYIFHKVGCDGAPLLLGFVLGPPMEENLRRAMLLARGDPMIFLERPIAATLLAITAGVLLLMVLPNFRQTREVAFKE